VSDGVKGKDATQRTQRSEHKGHRVAGQFGFLTYCVTKQKIQSDPAPEICFGAKVALTSGTTSAERNESPHVKPTCGAPGMNSQHTALFTTIDQYVKTHHHCFVAECDLHPERAQWSICIRPTEENARILDVYACKYVRLSLKEAEEVCTANAVPPKLAERIDRELHSISDSVSD